MRKGDARLSSFLIADFEEGESVRWGAEGGFLVAFGGGVDEIVKVVLAEVTLGGLDGGAGEKADHLIEEPVSGEGEEVAVGDLFEVGAGDLADVVGVFSLVAAVGGEGAEVV